MRRHPVAAKAPKRARAPKVLPRAAAPKTKRKAPFWQPRWIMDIISELRKVVWPTRQDTLHLTVVVVIVSAVIGASLGGIDLGFAWFVEHVLIP
jgi:preprotein translocase subunit SecE